MLIPRWRAIWTTAEPTPPDAPAYQQCLARPYPDLIENPDRRLDRDRVAGGLFKRQSLGLGHPTREHRVLRECRGPGPEHFVADSDVADPVANLVDHARRIHPGPRRLGERRPTPMYPARIFQSIPFTPAARTAIRT
jgi:hypothetical protein